MEQKYQLATFDSNMTQKVSFSKEDIDLILNSWSIVRRDLKSAGIAIFVKMFEQYPHYQSLFKKFSNVPIEDLPKDKVFISHAIKVAQALDKAFIQLENLEPAKLILKNIGKIHSNVNMEASHFIHCNEAILFVLKTNLAEKFNNEVEAAWNKLLPVIASLIVQGMISNE